MRPALIAKSTCGPEVSTKKGQFAAQARIEGSAVATQFSRCKPSALGDSMRKVFVLNGLSMIVDFPGLANRIDEATDPARWAG